MESEVEFILDAECGLGHYREAILSVWKGMPTVSLVDAHFSLSRKLVSKYGRSAMLIVIEQDAPPPNAEARQCIERFYADRGNKLAWVAQVIEGTGFGASAARAVVSTMNLMVRRPYPVSVFSKVTEAVPWLVNERSKYDHRAVEYGLAFAATVNIMRARQQWERPIAVPLKRISLVPRRCR